MYISGVPGTGKTATVNQVLEDLKQLAQKGEVPDFKCVQLNGMRLSDPRQAYVKIWQKLFGKEEKIPPDRAQKFLDDLFSKNNIKKKPIVLLVDEVRI